MKNGITLATLVIMIAIILIISTTVVVSSVNILNNSRLLKFGAEISYVQGLVDSYAQYNNGNLPVSDIVNLDVSNVNNEDLNQFSDEDIVDNKITLNKFDISLFEGIDLSYGNEKNSDKTDIYAVSSKTNKVYYLKGVNISGIKYFTLTEDLKEKIGYADDKNVVNKDGILFLPSTNDWTNQNITTTVKVPQKYTNIEVLVDGTNIEISDTLKEYNVYTINNITGNYNVIVNYTKDSESLTQEYYINKYDNVKPVISITNVQNFVSSEDKNVVLTINSNDALSGIKTLKYEIEKINEEEISSYFKNSGVEIQNNTIKLNKYVSQVTIYAEDNAGNISHLYKDIETVLDENDYVQTGLLLHYDGINNTGNGHSNTATTWKDLSGNGNDAELFGFDNNTSSGWNENSILFDGVNDWGNVKFYNISGNFTIEIKLAEPEIINSYNFGSAFTINNWSIQANKPSIIAFMDNRSESTAGLVRCFGTLVPAQNDIPFAERTTSTVKVNNDTLSMTKSSDKIVSYHNSKITRNLQEKDYINRFNLTDINLHIGTYADYTYGCFMKYKLYSMRIYNRALTEEEIKQNYLVDKARFNIE